MDVLEKWNRRFADWYEQLFADRDGDLRPRDILRRLVDSLEAMRREGLDGGTFVPNRIVVTVAVRDDAERDFLRAFVDGRELGDLVLDELASHGYRTRGPMSIAIRDVPIDSGHPRIGFDCRFEAAPEDPTQAPRPAESAFDPVSEPGTVAVPPRPVAVLEVAHPGGGVERVPVGPGGLRIGRGRSVGNDLVLGDDPQVSKRHARLLWDGSRLRVEDASSTNGTVVDSVPVNPEVPALAREGSVLVIGATRIVVRGPEPFPRPGAVRTWWLEGGDGRRWKVSERAMVGRGALDDIRIEGEGVSAQHARLSIESGVLRIEDLDAPGGTRVNGRRVPPRLPVALGENDAVELGSAQLRVATEPMP